MMRRLTVSEQKRAALIAQTTKLQMELERVKKSAAQAAVGSSGPGSPLERGGTMVGGRRATITRRSNSPSGAEGNSEELTAAQARLAASESQRLQLLRELEVAQEHAAQAAAAGGGGGRGITITAVPQANDDDFGFDEEEEARLRAEEVMSQLLHSLHSQRESQQQLSNAQLEITELRSALEVGKMREATLSAMVDEYQQTWRAQHSQGQQQQQQQQHVDVTSSIMGDLSPINNRSAGAAAGGGESSSTAEDEATAGGRRESLRIRLLEAKVKELQDECGELRQSLQGHEHRHAKLHGGGGAPLAPPASSYATTSVSGVASASTPLTTREQETHLREAENQQLLAFMVREQQFNAAIERLTVLVKEKNVQIKELKNVVRVQLAGGGSGGVSVENAAGAAALVRGVHK